MCLARHVATVEGAHVQTESEADPELPPRGSLSFCLFDCSDPAPLMRRSRSRAMRKPLTCRSQTLRNAACGLKHAITQCGQSYMDVDRGRFSRTQYDLRLAIFCIKLTSQAASQHVPIRTV